VDEAVGARGRRAAVPRVVCSLGRGIGAGDGGRKRAVHIWGGWRASIHHEASTLSRRGRAELVAAVILGMVRVCHEAHGPHLKSLLELRGRGGGHDTRVCVDALLWVDHVEIRLLLSRIKAVWAAMRQVRGVVAIVMVHEVKRGEQGSPV
jgi:hypothetical protein